MRPATQRFIVRSGRFGVQAQGLRDVRAEVFEASNRGLAPWRAVGRQGPVDRAQCLEEAGAPARALRIVRRSEVGRPVGLAGLEHVRAAVELEPEGARGFPLDPGLDLAE